MSKIADIASQWAVRDLEARQRKEAAGERIVWIVFADGDYDQTCYSEKEANKEKRDLTKMGFDVKVKKMTFTQADKKGWM